MAEGARSMLELNAMRDLLRMQEARERQLQEQRWSRSVPSDDDTRMNALVQKLGGDLSKISVLQLELLQSGVDLNPAPNDRKDGDHTGQPIASWPGGIEQHGGAAVDFDSAGAFADEDEDYRELVVEKCGSERLFELQVRGATAADSTTF